MIWVPSNRCDLEVTAIADRHYNRQTPGARGIAPPGRAMVLKHYDEEGAVDAFWITSFPYAEYTNHEWAGAYVCSAFRNESKELSSDMIREAVAITKGYYETTPLPENGFITFVDPKHVKRKRDWGRCYRKAGFREVGKTKTRKLIALQLNVSEFPPSIFISNFVHVASKKRTPTAQEADARPYYQIGRTRFYAPEKLTADLLSL